VPGKEVEEMGNRIVKHSSRYSGPAGDCRSASEIFEGIEKRAQQSQTAFSKLRDCLDNTLEEMILSSYEGVVESIKNTFIEWWSEHDIDVKERLESR
jgi:hypothetical protein